MSLKTKIFLGLLLFVPIAFWVETLPVSPLVVFAISGLAIVPLAAWIANSTEEIAVVTGPTIGGLLNATFGNATELIIAIVALRSGLVDIVEASISGSIIANLLLALGLGALLGGIRVPELTFESGTARMNSSSLLLAVTVLLTPTLIVATSPNLEAGSIQGFSVVTSVLLLGFYAMSILFSIKRSQATSELMAAEANGTVHGATAIHGEEVHHNINIPLQVGILLVATVGMVFVSEILVASLETATKDLGLSELFSGVILIPLFAGVVEYIACVTFAWKNKMDLAFNVAIGSTVQITMFVAPLLVLASSFFPKQMDLQFNIFEVLTVAMTILITNSIVHDGQMNWLEGLLLLVTYAVLGTAFYFHG
ncbi:calcium/proton antiporter [Gloeomargarita lithophora Alchichica-D10]|uniref:Ca(2+)/H(+) antiporter n=1 Tax=Gloeomargarita lithophora Alchichica-D10 TaxID=1188229 RepID=A0A1J0AFM2_9CYAN|nr:calcium/proton exchanger [Gloeomargarita lithophora]APB34699.1 calcium/proton antiporter [Gloeomargarita lithophora Alchichica-D10]